MPRYNEIPYIKPDVNGVFLLWLIVLGVPALLLFMVYTRQQPQVPVLQEQPTQIEGYGHPLSE